jgi:hypothetical protein
VGRPKGSKNKPRDWAAVDAAPKSKKTRVKKDPTISSLVKTVEQVAESLQKKDKPGLSPSSLQLFQSCSRKYYLKKVAKVDIDPDQKEDTEALNIGKAFHKVLEDTKHDVTGIKYAQVEKTAKGYDLDPEFHAPMIFAMLGAYKKVHDKAALRAIACEVEVETETFYGFVDAIFHDFSGKWWIADIKTAASYTPGLVPSLPKHQQLNLYAAHADVIAKMLGLEMADYGGIRYRVTTKSRIGRKAGEQLKDFIERLSKSVQSYDVVIPKEIMSPSDALEVHLDAFARVKSKEENNFPRNYTSCYLFYRPCEFWSRCHGRKYSDELNLEIIDGL